MKKFFLLALVSFVFFACGGSAENEGGKVVSDDATVYVYYFHGKQRCMTCNAVENVVKETVETYFGANDNVVFLPLLSDERANSTLVERYNVSWNGLIVSKGEDFSDITGEAFANAVNNSEVLVELLINEINNRL